MTTVANNLSRPEYGDPFEFSKSQRILFTIISTHCKFSMPAFVGGLSLSDSKSPTVFRTLLILSAHLNSAVDGMVLILPLINNYQFLQSFLQALNDRSKSTKPEPQLVSLSPSCSSVFFFFCFVLVLSSKVRLFVYFFLPEWQNPLNGNFFFSC